MAWIKFGLARFLDFAGEFFLLLAVFLAPIVMVCALLFILGRFINRRMYRSFGWSGVMVTAWIGTPIHEFSHYLGCLIARHRIVDFAIFKPDPKNASLGYVDHAYEADSFYQRVIGNVMVSLAPFFGGAIVIFALTHELRPELLVPAKNLKPLGIGLIDGWDGFLALASNWGTALEHFARQVYQFASTLDWRFFLYFFVVLSVGAHLSPSPQDFSGVPKPITVLFVAIFAIFVVLRIMSWNRPEWWQWLANGLLFLHTLLAASLMFVMVGAGLVFLITFLWNLLPFSREA